MTSMLHMFSPLYSGTFDQWCVLCFANHRELLKFARFNTRGESCRCGWLESVLSGLLQQLLLLGYGWTWLAIFENKRLGSWIAVSKKALSLNLSRASKSRKVDCCGTVDPVQRVTYSLFAFSVLAQCEKFALAVTNELCR